ncbi:MAG: OmpA family protein, partial [Bacteroidales bacterium]|nr:OmpA family protein [Bacteroidales bacterium]
MERGEKAFQNQNYIEAVEYFKEALPKARQKLSPDRLTDLVYRIGYAYLEMNRFEKALPWLEEAVFSGDHDEKQYMAYAEVLTNSRRIDKALKAYRKILKKNPSNSFARQRIGSLETMKSEQTVAVNLIDQEKINSKHSDYAPGWFMEKIVYTSARAGNKPSKNPRTGQYYSDLYSAEYNSRTGKWEGGEAFSDKLNSRKAEGGFAYDRKSRTAYFTRCFETQKPCQIMYSRLDREGEWSRPKKIPFNKNVEVGHPTLNSEGNTLYFVADIDGGVGGKDIWKMRRLGDKEWSVPVNLSTPVNSEFDELFPYYAYDSLLFFASNRGQALGGLDLFVAVNRNGTFAKPRRLDSPFNTTRDDFGLIIRNDKGLFCSNRKNKRKSDDIFSFRGLPFLIEINGQVVAQGTNTPVERASLKLVFDNFQTSLEADSMGYYSCKVPLMASYTVEVSARDYSSRSFSESWKNRSLFLKDTVITRNYYLNKKTAAATIKGKVVNRKTKKVMPQEKLRLYREGQLMDSTKTDNRGVYSFKNLSSKGNYTVKISKEGFFSESRQCMVPELTTPAVFSAKTGYDMDFQLTRIQKEKEIVINNILYDFNKASLRPESRKELDKLVSMLKETPNVIIQINSHTDTRGSRSYNQRLSQRRARSVVDYLTRHGIDTDRLFAKGYGESRPLVQNAQTETEHQLNRRTSFKVLA